MLGKALTPTFIGDDKLLGSLALLRTSFLPQDFISTYVPFVATLLIEKDYDSTDIEIIINDFKAYYGFIIPRSPMIAILKKCAIYKIIFRRDNGTYSVNKEVAKQYCFADKAKSEIQKYNYILKRFAEYAKVNYSREISNEDAEKIFLAFLEDNSAKTLRLDFGTFDSRTQANKQNFYIVSNFITDTSKNDYELFKLVKDIATAHLIASAITYDANEDGAAESIFHDLILYLDTPFVLRALGLNTDEMRLSYIDLMNELAANKSTFKIFGHTYDEIYNILQDCERWIENPNYNATYASLALRTFVKKKYTKNDIGLYISSLPDKLKALSIEVDDTDYYDKKYNLDQIDDTLIRNNLIRIYKESTPNFDISAKQYTIEYDVKSISSIFKLRGKIIYRTYANAKFLFLTTNPTLAYVSRKFTAKENPSARYKVYPCLTDVALGTNVWLNSPITRIENFSQKKLLADCMASMTPSDELINLLSESIERLHQSDELSEKDYYLMKSHAFNNYYIERLTLNDEAAFNDKITEEILEEIREEIISPYTEKIDKLGSAFQEANTYIADLEYKLEQVEKEKSKDKEKEKEKYEDALDKSRTMVDKIIHFLLPVGIGIIILFISFILIFNSNFNKVNVILKVASGIIGFISTLVGGTLKINLWKARDILVNRLKSYYMVKAYKENELKNISIDI